MLTPKHVHIVGICGVATSAIAIAFHKAGWKVTGSDKGFFPPVSTELEENHINFYAGWHPEKIGKPDLIMIGGGGTSPSNPEIIYAKENNIPVYPYAEILSQYFIKKNSIVITGTWGKTTISSLLSFILLKANFNPSYFTGGLSLSHDTGAISSSDWSVVEGDEYQVSISDKRPKFVYYSPTHLLLTSVSWDHADLYPTEESYFDTFKDLVKESKTIVACIDNKGVAKIVKDKKVISYGKSDEANYQYLNVNQTKNGIDFSIKNNNEIYKISSSMFGAFNAENITGSFAMAKEIGIDAGTIINAIKDFKGIKRRFEKRFEGNITIMDCHAPTPEKVLSVLKNIREVYDKKIIAIFEPNIGGRQKNSSHMYNNAFSDANIVIIPHLTKLKTSQEKPMEGDELTEIIKKTHDNTFYIEDDDELVKFVIDKSKKDDVIVFLGSHGFRGIIETLVKIQK